MAPVGLSRWRGNACTCSALVNDYLSVYPSAGNTKDWTINADRFIPAGAGTQECHVCRLLRFTSPLA
ncbi:hypothetical protein KCP73_17790 [Salmonella enterica subsp. enterica]|nr:hypothetical protein KCP73_17790 [Salmonella enterica subsp. enterica]